MRKMGFFKERRFLLVILQKDDVLSENLQKDKFLMLMVVVRPGVPRTQRPLGLFSRPQAPPGFDGELTPQELKRLSLVSYTCKARREPPLTPTYKTMTPACLVGRDHRLCGWSGGHDLGIPGGMSPTEGDSERFNKEPEGSPGSGCRG